MELNSFPVIRTVDMERGWSDSPDIDNERGLHACSLMD